MHPTKALHAQDLLDVGCGTGSFLKAVCGKFKTATGVEYNDGMIGEARKQEFSRPVTLLQGAADKLPFPDASFDLITFNQVIHHFPSADDFAYLAQAALAFSRTVQM